MLRFGLLPLGLFLLATGGLPAHAQEALRYAAVLDTQGEPQAQVDGIWNLLVAGKKLDESTRIRTPAGAAVVLLLIEGNRQIGQLKIGENSELVLERMFSDPATGRQSTLLDVAVGNVLLNIGALPHGSSFEVKTPVSTSGVRGTGFSVDYNGRSRASETAVYEGTVAVWHLDPATGEPVGTPVLVAAGTRARVEAEAGVQEPTPLSSEEMAQTMRELDKLKTSSTQKPQKEIRRERMSIRKPAPTPESTGEERPALPRFGLFLLSIGLALVGLAWLWGALQTRSWVGILLASAMIAGAVWLFLSNKLQWNEFPRLADKAFSELELQLKERFPQLR